MKIGILGTGIVGRTLGGRIASLDHRVVMGTRDVERTRTRTEPQENGIPPFGAWHEEHPEIHLGTFAEAARHGQVVINATSGKASLDALRAAGTENLDGKILIDASNPLDFSKGMPPVLTVCNSDSAAERIQRAFPSTKVVKALNTISAPLMTQPDALGGGDHTLFICGNDKDAKASVRAWLGSWFGWRDVLDLGDITAARGAEMYLPFWLRVFGALGTGMFNIKVVR